MRYYYKTITALHAGTGTELGIVDLPIQRDSLTKFPKIEASTLKGSLKSRLLDISDKKEMIYEYLGREDKSQDCEISKVGIGDAKLLLFPIALRAGDYCYITCKDIIKDNEDIFNIGKKDKIKLEHYEVEVEKISIKEEKINIEKNIYCLKNEIFKMLVENYTEVHTRIKINDETGTVDEKSGPFTVEYLPRETYLYNEIFSTRDYKRKIDDFSKLLKECEEFQVGGDKSLGKGFLKIIIFKE